MDWLEKNQDKSLEDIQASIASGSEETSAGHANSLVCNECGKRFREQSQAEFHANKSGHTDFSESTEEIAPLTEEQKKEVEEHNKDFDNRHDRGNVAPGDKVDKKFWGDGRHGEKDNKDATPKEDK